ncbi:uncharacterized protein LOC110976687 [Acanthaster planci]|uniref:Uncharacterized protein LOC110976687 n=1 Tax=Acanthaster planci TaxID=133434 RepID=A0A8B7Y0P9_ACAPL|nr:uncharacterized protein LOC110976687 [Acanthaster planci]
MCLMNFLNGAVVLFVVTSSFVQASEQDCNEWRHYITNADRFRDELKEKLDILKDNLTALALELNDEHWHGVTSSRQDELQQQLQLPSTLPSEECNSRVNFECIQRFLLVGRRALDNISNQLKGRSHGIINFDYGTVQKTYRLIECYLAEPHWNNQDEAENPCSSTDYSRYLLPSHVSTQDLHYSSHHVLHNLSKNLRRVQHNLTTCINQLRKRDRVDWLKNELEKRTREILLDDDKQYVGLPDETPKRAWAPVGNVYVAVAEDQYKDNLAEAKRDRSALSGPARVADSDWDWGEQVFAPRERRYSKKDLRLVEQLLYSPLQERKKRIPSWMDYL